jgi:hypothetical protein
MRPPQFAQLQAIISLHFGDADEIIPRLKRFRKRETIMILPPTSIPYIQTVPGDLRAGNVFPKPVRTLCEETIPQVRETPGNSRDVGSRRTSSFALKILGIFQRITGFYPK